MTQDTPREYDIVFNATYDDLGRKRHALMLELLKHPLLREKRALFLGRGREKNVERFRDLVKRAGLTARITIMANLPRREVPRQLGRCKMGVHLSLYENCCRSIYEFFRSDLPCVISSSMGGMNRTIFNVQTGMAVTDDELPEAISFVLTHLNNFTARRWFLANSGSSRSTSKLNGFLKALYQTRGYLWEDDIVPLLSSGPNRYANRSDYERFRDEFCWIRNCLRASGKLPVQISVD